MKRAKWRRPVKKLAMLQTGTQKVHNTPYLEAGSTVHTISFVAWGYDKPSWKAGVDTLDTALCLPL
jgi:hypothetical protein